VGTLSGTANPGFRTRARIPGPRPPPRANGPDRFDGRAKPPVELTVCDSEAALLRAVGRFADGRLDGDRHYLTAYNGETWNGGFDPPSPMLRYPGSSFRDERENSDRI